jgi:hypothetical protein
MRNRVGARMIVSPQFAENIDHWWPGLDAARASPCACGLQNVKKV